MTNKCECEHIDHFDNGPKHPYGSVPAITTIRNEYGTFALCTDCRKAGHMS